MLGRTNAGGGGTSPFAFIFAIYPAGSVCTCTDGSRTLKLKDTSGYGVFYPPYVGIWTVTITDPTGANKPVSTTAEITKEGESVSVELSYWDGTLYDAGEEYNNITGGWVITGDTSKEESCINFICNRDSEASAYTAKKIDLTPYKTLTFEVERVRNSSAILGVTENPTGNVKTVADSMTAKLTITKDGTYQLDISAINKPLHIWVGDYSESTNTYGACLVRAKLS